MTSTSCGAALCRRLSKCGVSSRQICFAKDSTSVIRGKGQILEHLAYRPLQRVPDRVDANGYAARSAARRRNRELDLFVDADRGEHVACDGVEESTVEVAVRDACDLQRKAPLYLDPQRSIIDRRSHLLTQDRDRSADVTFVQLDALHRIRARGLPVAAHEVARRPARDAREFRVVVLEALPKARRPAPGSRERCIDDSSRSAADMKLRLLGAALHRAR